MDYAYIEQLLERYFQADTTEQEERILQAFFRQDILPAHLQQYAPLFRTLDRLGRQQLGDDFDRRLLQRAGLPLNDRPAPRVAPRPLTLFDRVRPYFRAAAAVAIVALLAGSVERAITRSPQPQAPLAVQKAVPAESIASEMETLRPMQPLQRTAAADSAAAPLPQ